MSTNTPTPYDWIKTVSSTLIEHDDTPLLGKVPPFPWDSFAENLAKTFELEELTIQHGDWSWKTEEQVTAGLGSSLRTLTFNVTPLEGLAACILSADHLNTITGWLLKKTLPSLPDEDCEAFLRLFIMEALHHHQKVYPLEKLTPSLASATAPFKGEALTLDITLNHQQQQIALRFALSSELRKAWQVFHSKGKPSPKEESIAQKTDVAISGQVASVTLSPKQWKKISAGDFLLLDQCTVAPSEEPGQMTGQILLTHKGKPLFVSELEEDKVKIIGYPTAKQS